MDEAKALQALALLTEALGVKTDVLPVQWWHPVGTAPTAPLTDLSNEAEIMRYASFGLKPNLKRGVSPSDDAHMIALCDQLADPNLTPEGAEHVIAGAGKFPTNVAIYFVRTGCTQGFSSLLEPSIFAPSAIQTIHDAALYALSEWTGGAGPGLG